MNIDNLKQIAYYTLIKTTCNQLPVDSRIIAKDIGITLIDKIDNKLSEIYPDQKAILINSESPCIYYTTPFTSKINLDMACEIATYLLRSSQDSFSLEDVQILGIFLLAPPIVIQKLKFSLALEIKAYCNIPEYESIHYLNVLTYKGKTTDSENQVRLKFHPYIKSFKRKNLFRPIAKFLAKLVYKSAVEDLDRITDEDVIQAAEIVDIESNTYIYHIHNSACIQSKQIKNIPRLLAEEKGYKPCKKCYKDKD